ncbi:MAG: sugar-binding protein [Bacteroidales bacterium]|nr:sugar-binding protein [Bacteroidales bacterium]
MMCKRSRILKKTGQNSRSRLLGLLVATCCWITFVGQMMAQSPPSTMIGRQSNNVGIRAVPAPGAVAIDGNLTDWDLSGRIWSFADIAIRDRYSAETAVMWDKEYLYLAFKFRDPTPLFNTINPAFDPQSGWKGDAIQLRFITDWPLWITLWNFSTENKSAMLHSFWKDKENDNIGQDNKLMVGQPGSTKLGDGVEMAFKTDEDKKGYVQEVRIPWKLLYKNGKVPDVVAGLNFRMGVEYYWGPAVESTWPMHRYADNMQPGATSREFFWTARKVWGDVTLLPKGKVEKLNYILAGQKLEGSIPVKITIPAKAKEFTVVIETKDGQRLRNLGAQLNPELYSVSVKNEERMVEVLWDGRDDAGKMVSAGVYKVRGLSHEGLGADYVMAFYNPGTPPWDAGQSGNWGADHGAPQYAAANGNWAILAWGFAEGGSGIIGIGPDGLKKWGEKRGVQALAADEKSVYFISRSWETSGNLCRLNKLNGKYSPFVLDGKERPFELSLNDVLGNEAASFGNVLGMTSYGEKLALAMSGGKVVVLDNKSARLLKTIDVPALTAIAFGPDGRCYLISNNKLAEVNLETNALRSIATPGLFVNNSKNQASSAKNTNEGMDLQKLEELKNQPIVYRTLTVDPKGFIGIFDNGPDQQVKFYSPEGAFQYAAGRKGGRPIRGNFDEQAMSHVTSVAVDQLNQIWVTECWEYPRRVSVWGSDGKLIRDYVGNTGYAGTGTFLHDEDPTLAYYGPVEMKLDMQKRTWKVTRVLWVPGKGELFPVSTKVHAHPHRFSSKAGGKLREFMFQPPYRSTDPYVLYMEGDDKAWRPVASIGALGLLSGELSERDGKVIRQPEGEYAGLNAYDAYFWNDTNKDGKVQFSEVTIVSNPKPAVIGKNSKLPIPFISGWGGRMASEDLSFVTSGVARYVPIRYTEEGAPVYGPAGIKKYITQGNGDFVPDLKEKSVLALMSRGNFATNGLSALDAETGKELWSYPNPYPGVHGSHLAPMPQPGLIIGPLKILGVADLPNGNGRVFGMRGNLGQDFYMTTDGLLIGTVFQDGRLPSMSLPKKETELYGAPMESFGGGGEPFVGWFGKQNDGKVRLISGISRQSALILEMKGLENIKRFIASPVNVTSKQLATAAAANDIRIAAAAKSAEKRQTIVKLTQAPVISGRNKGWGNIPSFAIVSKASGYKGKAQLAYDADYLYLAMDVEDPNPWKNEGVDFLRLFKTGDAVDIQISGDPKSAVARIQPVKGDFRVVLANLNNQPSAILMQPINPLAPKNMQKVYTSPVGDKKFDEVRVFKTATVAVVKNESGYRIEAALPLKELGLQPVPGTDFRGDIGFISSDVDGRINIARTYWSNQATNLVNDEPMESWLFPATWGVFSWGK